jgi:hypothetical protein
VLREAPTENTQLEAPERTPPLTEVATHRDEKVGFHDHRTAGVFLMVVDTARLAEEPAPSRTADRNAVADAEDVSRRRSMSQNSLTRTLS